jgi:hypothetical protein
MTYMRFNLLCKQGVGSEPADGRRLLRLIEGKPEETSKLMSKNWAGKFSTPPI